jgi:hypothetical protein
LPSRRGGEQDSDGDDLRTYTDWHGIFPAVVYNNETSSLSSCEGVCVERMLQ